MRRTASGFYHDPPIWVGVSPIDWAQKGAVDFESFRREAFRASVHSGIEIKATTEGLFAFDYSGWPSGQFPPEPDGKPAPFEATAAVIVKRTYVMNAFLAFLYTACALDDHIGIDRMVVTPELTISMDNLGDDSGMSFGSNRVSYLALSRYPSTYNLGLPASMDQRISMRGGPISVSAVERASTSLSSLLRDQGEEGLLLADLFLRASKAHQDHNHSLSLITYWTIIEKLLNTLWLKLQSDHKQRDGVAFISRERKKRLADGRTFTVAVISETLSFMGYLPLDLYNDLTHIRKTRNDWMHNLKTADANDASVSSNVCEKLLLEVKGIRLAGASGLRVHG